MLITVLLTAVIPYIAISCSVQNDSHVKTLANASKDKEMYVIHAMVYQVGILTNKTEDEVGKMNSTGTQETVTFYHNNGSNIDLSDIAAPLLTNVTAQTLVGIAPVSDSNNTWAISAGAPGSPNKDSNIPLFLENVSKGQDGNYAVNNTKAAGRSSHAINKIFKRDVPSDTPVKVLKGSAVIPEAAGIHSISIPPLLTLNNNFSDIPVPIPNTSVVQYAKINTLITKP